MDILDERFQGTLYVVPFIDRWLQLSGWLPITSFYVMNTLIRLNLGLLKAFCYVLLRILNKVLNIKVDAFCVMGRSKVFYLAIRRIG